jgi:nucleotidyltransferase AbiEii toxin of type IV toxin-antitoxin system
MASIEDIIAMKVQVIANGGRKKDFWDLHELMNDYPINTMISLHEERYPYEHNVQEIIDRFTNFSQADEDFEPRCHRGKHWELIKLDFVNAMKPMQIL